MAKLVRIKSSSKRKKLLLLFVVVSILFISCGYAIVNSNLGFLGTIFVNQYKNKAVIQSFSKDDTTKFRSDTYRTKIETITLSESISPPDGYIESWNLGINGKSNVMGYITKRSGTETDIYDLYIQGDGNLYANPDSTYLFGGFEGLKEIIGLDKLNTSEVTNMSYMFAVNASYFSGKSKLTSLYLSGFDTSKVTNMSYMFYYCNGLSSLDLSNFNTSNVTNMSYMFRYCNGLTSLDVSGFDTSNVTNMSYMFYYCSGLTSLDVSKFDTSKVINMGWMFSSCSSLTSLNLNNFDTHNVINMSGMFGGDIYHHMKLSEITVGDNWNTQKVTDMSFLFNCFDVPISQTFLSKLDTRSVTNMQYMFQYQYYSSSLDLSGFDTSKVTNMSYMFSSCSKLTSLDVSGLDTSNVTNMSNMFYICSGLTSLDLSGFDASNVTDISYMFSYCSNLATIYVNSKWNVANVTNGVNMFYGCGKIVGQSGVAYNSSKVDVTMANYETGYLTYYTTEIYTINYNLDGGSVSGNPTSYTTYTNTFTLKEPTKVGYKFKGWLDEQDNLYYKEPYNERYSLTFGDNYFILNQNIEGNSINSFRVNLSTLDGLTYIDTIAYSSIEYFSTVYSFVAETGDYLLYLNANTNKSDGGLVVGMHFIKGEKYVISWHKVYGNAQEYKIENFKIYRQGGSEVSVPVGTIPRGSIGNRSFRALWEAA